MGTAPEFCVTTGDPNTLQVAGGSLKLNTVRYSDPSDSSIQYAVPSVLSTQDPMNFRYGYVEMYAKLPISAGRMAGILDEGGRDAGSQAIPIK